MPLSLSVSWFGLGDRSLLSFVVSRSCLLPEAVAYSKLLEGVEDLEGSLGVEGRSSLSIG